MRSLHPHFSVTYTYCEAACGRSSEVYFQENFKRGTRMSRFNCQFRYGPMSHCIRLVALPCWPQPVPQQVARSTLRGHVGGQLVFVDAFGRRSKVRAAMSLRDGMVYVHPTGQRCDAAVPARGWPDNPSGDGELQIWGFGCVPVRDGRMHGSTQMDLSEIAREFRRRAAHSRSSAAHRGH